jgi:hypothetical protein
MSKWETEPDFLEFIDEDTRYKCFIGRHSTLGHLCGYVELPKEHKLYDNISEENIYNNFNLEVHGGVTFTGRKQFKKQNIIIDNVIGFDCAHCGDFSPYGNLMYYEYEEYRDIGYVINECKKLAKQLKRLEQ